MNINRILKFQLWFLVSLLFSGCVSTYVSGEKMAPIEKNIDKLGIVIVDARFNGYNQATSLGNSSVAELFPHLVTRLPIIFSLNGIDAKAVLLRPGIGISGSTKEIQEFDEILQVVPQSASWNSRTGSQLVLQAQIRDKKSHRVLWQGSVTLSTMGFGKFDEALADVFAEKLLTKLKKDGVILLPSDEVKIPEKNGKINQGA